MRGFHQNLFAKPRADWRRESPRGLAAVTSKLVANGMFPGVHILTPHTGISSTRDLDFYVNTMQ
jgi:hypothetical protein